MAKTICGIQLKDIKRADDLMLVLVLRSTLDQLATVNIVHWHGHVLRREDGHVLRREDGHALRRAIHLSSENQRKKGWPKRTLKKQVEEENIKIGLSKEDALCW